MRCKDIERLIVDASEGGLSQEEIRAIEEHISSCEKCTRLYEEWEGIRVCLRNSSKPVLPDSLVLKTQELCYREMKSLRGAPQRSERRVRNHTIPKLIWAAIASLILITGFLLLPLIRDIELEQTFSFPAVVVLFLIIQNAAMLFFTPVILRKFRSQNHHLGSA
jgi:anti-sigma factor RsiW